MKACFCIWLFAICCFSLIFASNGGTIDDSLILETHSAPDSITFVENVKDNSIKMWKKKAKEGVACAYRMLGDQYKDVAFNKNNWDKAQTFYLKAAELGDIYAYSSLARIYRLGLKRNYEKSFEYFIKAAGCGIDFENINIACSYLDGIGVRKDYAKADQYLDLCITKQVAVEIAHFYKGWMSMNGFGVNKDIKQAIRYLEQSAESGFTDAGILLGLIYFDGKYQRRDIEKSKQFLHDAYDKANVNTKTLIASSIVFKPFFSAIKDQGFRWLKDLAESNKHPYAQYLLAKCYDFGIGAYTDRVSAAAWYATAYQNDKKNDEIRYGMARYYAINQQSNLENRWKIKQKEKEFKKLYRLKT